MTRLALIAALVAVSTTAAAAPTRVALAPLSTLGAEARSKEVRATEAVIAAGLAAVPETEIVADRELRGAVDKAKRPELKSCDGEVACLAELGALVGAAYVVSGELGGLGGAQVVFLEVVDVATRRSLRSTTLELGGERDAAREARAAAYRLLAPADYVGSIALDIDVKGTTVYMDGAAVTPAPHITAEVGTHALRVTHPEYRDYVRFVDVPFGETVTLQVGMKAFPIVETEMHQREGVNPLGPGPGQRDAPPPPWYRRWYTVAGAGVVLFVGSALVFGYVADGIDADREKTVQ